MTRDEFISQMNRLSDTFPNQYKSERANLFWSRVAPYPLHAFKKIVDELIGECRQAPLLPDLEAKLAIVREKEWSQKKYAKVLELDPKRSNCPRCCDTGVFPARHKMDGSGWAFKCTCPVGQKDVRPFPIWTHSEDYAL